MVRDIAERVRFERYPTVGIVGVDNVCRCWQPTHGPFVEHPAACLCPCHSVPPQFGG